MHVRIKRFDYRCVGRAERGAEVLATPEQQQPGKAHAPSGVLGVHMDGHNKVLGLWIAKSEDTQCGHQVVTELNNRGVLDIFIAYRDALKGFPEAMETVYPKASVQRCIVHLVRNCFNCVGRKARKAVAAPLPLIYTAAG